MKITQVEMLEELGFEENTQEEYLYVHPEDRNMNSPICVCLMNGEFHILSGLRQYVPVDLRGVVRAMIELHEEFARDSAMEEARARLSSL